KNAAPIQLLRVVVDTAALMLTVASPRTGDVEIRLRAQGLRTVLAELRNQRKNKGGARVSAAYCLPQSVSLELVRLGFDEFARTSQRDRVFSDLETFSGSGCIGLDAVSSLGDSQIRDYIQDYIRNRVHASEIHPDAWGPLLIRDLDDIEKQMTAVAGDKYSYRELDDFTDLIARTLIGTLQASKYQRAGVVPEWIFLDYSQERVASYGL